MKKTITTLTLAAFLAAVLPGCSTNTRGDDAAPVFLSTEFREFLLQKLLIDHTQMQFNEVIVSSHIKNPTVTATEFLDVVLDSYTVEWTRLDGGRTASKTEVFGGTGIVPAGGQSTLNNYPFMSATALLLPPLDQLYPFNGGIDHETGSNEIRQAGHVKFYGHTLSGQPVESVPATFNITFLYGGAAGRVEGKIVR